LNEGLYCQEKRAKKRGREREKERERKQCNGLLVQTDVQSPNTVDALQVVCERDIERAKRENEREGERERERENEIKWRERKRGEREK
jgi:hypothetical protein